MSQLDARLRTLEARIDRNEQQLRSYRRLAAVLGLTACGALGLAAKAPQDVDPLLKTRQLQVLGENGRVVFEARGDGPGGYVELFDSEGLAISHWGVGEAGGEFGLRNLAGSPTAQLTSDPHGGQARLYNGEGKLSAFVGASGEGGTLDLASPTGRPFARIQASGDRGHLELSGSKGTGRLSAGPAPGGPRLTLGDDRGQAAAELRGSTVGGALSLARPGEKGRPGFEASVIPAGGALQMRSASGDPAFEVRTGKAGNHLVLAHESGSPALEVNAHGQSAEFILKNAQDEEMQRFTAAPSERARQRPGGEGGAKSRAPGAGRGANPGPRSGQRGPRGPGASKDSEEGDPVAEPGPTQTRPPAGERPNKKAPGDAAPGSDEEADMVATLRERLRKLRRRYVKLEDDDPNRAPMLERIEELQALMLEAREGNPPEGGRGSKAADPNGPAPAGERGPGPDGDGEGVDGDPDDTASTDAPKKRGGRASKNRETRAAARAEAEALRARLEALDPESPEYAELKAQAMAALRASAKDRNEEKDSSDN